MKNVKDRSGQAPSNSLAARKRVLKLGRLTLPYIMVLPAMIILAVFTFYPAFYMIYTSFFRVDFFRGNEFVGFQNYYELFFVELEFWEALRNTLIYMVAATVSVIVLALIFAVWLQKSSFINGIAQRMMFLPYLCSGVTIAMIWSWLMDTEGLLNVVLEFFNLPALGWINKPDTALLSVIIVSVWKSIGYYALIMLSSVKSIPTEVLEAAELDDSGKLRTFFKIQLPLLSPQIFFLFITITMNSFKVFDIVRLLTAGQNDTMVLVYYIYTQAFNYNNYGMACAASVFLMIIMALFSIVYFKAMSKRVHYQ